MRIRFVAIAGSAVCVVAVALTPATFGASAGKVAAPVLGDWEGVGPHRLPFSLVLTRSRGRVVVSDLTVGDPVYCPPRVLATDANPEPRASYLGPGAEPLIRIGWAPSTVEIRIGMGAPFNQEWVGQLRGPRSMTLSEPIPVGLPKGCSWGSAKRLFWHLAPAHRLAVSTGAWSGQTAVPGTGTDTVTLHVNATGRIVDDFQVKIACPDGTSSWGVGPAKVGAFIRASGHFVDSYGSGFVGTFGRAGTVTGTLNGDVGSGCGSGRLPFSATPESPR
jgi:hypothetical protein